MRCCCPLVYVLSIPSLLLLEEYRANNGSLRIILISTLSPNIVLIIHMLDVLPRVVLRLLAINVIQTLGLEELVDLSSCNTDEEFLGELVGDGLACMHTH